MTEQFPGLRRPGLIGNHDSDRNKLDPHLVKKSALRKRQMQLLEELSGKMKHYKKHLKQQFQNILDVVELPFDGENPIQMAETCKKLHAKTNPELLRKAKIKFQI